VVEEKPYQPIEISFQKVKTQSASEFILCAIMSHSYDRSSFVDAPSGHYDCPICLNIMKNPVQCPSEGHTFCRTCVIQYLEIERVRDEDQMCPTCRAPLTSDKLFPNRSLCNLIGEAIVYCPSLQQSEGGRRKRARDEGQESCEWTGKLNDTESYDSQCLFSETTCPHNDCNYVLIRREIPEHIRLLPCGFVRK
jgi:hypothetical protein